MSLNEAMSFGSVEEELEYWKDQALQLRQEWVNEIINDNIIDNW